LIIVTGAAGFIGSHVAEKLAEKGYEILAIDNLSNKNPANIEVLEKTGATLLKIDVADHKSLLESVARLVKPGDPEAVVHIAAVVSVEESGKNPWRTVRVNIEGTLNVLELARRLDIERIVYASSAAVYGEPQYLPINETHPLQPLNLYGETKVAGERLLWLYQRTYGLKPIALRYFNVYGPRMSPGPYAGVVHSFITRLLRRETPIIHGDGNQTRDFIYVEDVAEATTKAAETKATGPINIGTGRETSINQLYRTICKTIGYCPKPLHLPPRPQDPRRSRADITRARQLLGWTPRTSLEQGLRQTIEYYWLMIRE